MYQPSTMWSIDRKVIEKGLYSKSKIEDYWAPGLDIAVAVAVAAAFDLE